MDHDRPEPPLHCDGASNVAVVYEPLGGGAADPQLARHIVNGEPSGPRRPVVDIPTPMCRHLPSLAVLDVPHDVGARRGDKSRASTACRSRLRGYRRSVQGCPTRPFQTRMGRSRERQPDWTG